MQVDLPAHGWTPRPAQMNAWRALRKGTNPVILAWHRRMGKDEVALHNAAIKTMERVGNYWHMLPIQEQARKAIWEAVNPRTGRVRWKDAFPDELIRHVDNQTMKLTLVNGSTTYRNCNSGTAWACGGYSKNDNVPVGIAGKAS